MTNWVHVWRFGFCPDIGIAVGAIDCSIAHFRRSKLAFRTVAIADTKATDFCGHLCQELALAFRNSRVDLQSEDFIALVVNCVNREMNGMTARHAMAAL
jgi:hypothetical protein